MGDSGKQVNGSPPGKRIIGAGLLLKLPKHLWYLAKCILSFKRPFSFYYHYIKGTSPADKTLTLRNGCQIHLSDHPHDVRTVFVVFVKRDYGRVNSGVSVLDLGSNIGVFSLYSALAGAKTILAFEPSLGNYNVLLGNIDQNGLRKTIQPYKRAVSATPGQRVRFSLSAGPYNQILEGPRSSDQFELVETSSLDSIIEDHALESIDLLKADCEGAEYDLLLKASKSSLDRIRSIKIEFHRWPLDDLLIHLEKNGFRCTHLDRDNAVLWMDRSG